LGYSDVPISLPKTALARTEDAIRGIEDAAFQKYAQDAKQNCPVSKTLAGTVIHLNGKLV
jgi:osmotically inducible protein OsmC